MMDGAAKKSVQTDDIPEDRARDALAGRSLVFVGLMGAGKSVIGRKAAQALKLDFVDSDHEIETVSRHTISELFELYGETEFRALEARVIRRLIESGQCVVSTGGGAFMNAETRAFIKQNAVSVWLKADLEVLWGRVSKRDNRPLLKTADPKATLDELLRQRYPIYSKADITVISRDVPKDTMVKEVIAAIADRQS